MTAALISMVNIEIPKESLCNLRRLRASMWALSESPPFFPSLGQLYQASPEVGPVRSHEHEQHRQQRVLGVKSETESRKSPLQESKNQKEHEVRGPYLRILAADHRP